MEHGSGVYTQTTGEQAKTHVSNTGIAQGGFYRRLGKVGRRAEQGREGGDADQYGGACRSAIHHEGKTGDEEGAGVEQACVQ